MGKFIDKDIVTEGRPSSKRMKEFLPVLVLYGNVVEEYSFQ
jgi:hypothetical protein